jgi:hypothetical protein
MAAQEQDAAAPHPVEIVESGMPAFYVSSFNLSTTSNEVVLIGNELFPTWGGNEAAPAAISFANRPERFDDPFSLDIDFVCFA